MILDDLSFEKIQKKIDELTEWVDAIKVGMVEIESKITTLEEGQ